MNMLGDLDINSFVLLFILIIIEVISTNFIQSYINNKNIIYIISGCSGYLIVGILFYYYLLYYKGSLAIGNILWQVCNVLLVTLLSVLYYKEKLSYKQIIGIILIILGFILV